MPDKPLPYASEGELEANPELRALLEARREKNRQFALTNPAFKANHGRLKKTGRPAGAGRPKALPRFRKAARSAAFEVLAEIRNRMHDPDVPLGELVRAFAELADRGGFLKSKEET